MKPKYVVCPGKVTSKNDGQEHYIGPVQLMRLYGVDSRECEIYEPAPWWPQSYYREAEKRQQGIIRLYPRYGGDYSLPSNVQIEPTARLFAQVGSNAGLGVAVPPAPTFEGDEKCQ